MYDAVKRFQYGCIETLKISVLYKHENIQVVISLHNADKCFQDG